MSYSKDKGNRFERDVAKLLTELFNCGDFLRVPTSGAYTGGKNKDRIRTMSSGQVKSFRGDIIPPDNIELIVECKNHKDFPSFHTILTGENSKLDKWLKEVIYDSENGGIPHLLAFKITGTRSIFFALPSKHFNYNNIKDLKEYPRSFFYVEDDNSDYHEYCITEEWVFSEIKDSILKVIKKA